MSLYNEVRPQTLSEVRGQDNIKNQLEGLFLSERIPNAMLFTGPRGTGKTTIARIVAKTLNCGNLHDGEPCNTCQSCKDIMSGNSMDVIELDAASNNKVEDVRGIIEKAQYKPLGKYKVFILDEVHMFSTGAWNALLKTIEEPPKNCIFIMCTTEEHKVPATIISRSMKFYFQKIDLGVVAEYLAQICDERGKAYDDDALKLIAQASEGCMRDALSIMESFFETDSLFTEAVAKTLGMSQENAIFDILVAINDGDSTKAISTVRDVAKMGRNLQLLVKGIVNALSDAIFVMNGADIDETIVNTNAYKQRLGEYVSQNGRAFSPERAVELCKQFSSVYGALTKTPDAEFLVETAIIGAIECESEIGRVYRMVEELKAQISNGAFVSPVVEKTETPRIEQPVDSEFNKAESEDLQPVDLAPISDGFESIDDEDLIPFDEDKVVPFTQDNSAKAMTNDVTPLESSPSGDSLPVADDIPFEEDSFNIPSMAEVNALFEEPQPKAPVETPVVNTPAPEPIAPVVEEKHDDMAELLAHLPKGTKITNLPTSKPEPKAVETQESSSNVTEVNTQVAGEDEPLIKANNDLPPLGFDGFSGWL